MAVDPRITAIEQFVSAMQEEANAMRRFHEATQARTVAQQTIGDHILDEECWVYGDTAMIRDAVTRQVRRLVVVHLG